MWRAGVLQADMVNHKRPRDAWWGYLEKENRFVIQSVINLEAKREIFVSYGMKCNSRLFVNYGFTLLTNEFNQALTSHLTDPHVP